MNTDHPKKEFKSGFWRLGNVIRRQKLKIDQLSEIYRRQTRKIVLPDIFERPTRKIEIAQNIFERPTRKIHLQDIFQRSTRKVNLPDIFQRPTRKIGKQTNIFQQNIRKCAEALEDYCERVLQVDLIDTNNRHTETIASEFRQPIDQPNRNEPHTIVYSSQLLLSGPIPLSRSVYKDIYDQNKQFPVDDFRAGSCHHFLTRFHPDQYAGLTEKFTGYVYASKITAYLVRKIIKVDGCLLRILNPDLPVIVNGVEITAINVPSYPGALMILFKSLDGRVELHGGYMHTSAELEQVSTIWNTQIDAMIIYNNPSILMPANGCWDETVYREEMTKIIDEHMETQRRDGLVGLIVFNSHKHIYSMEAFFAPFAHFYGLSIWADDDSKCLIEGLEIEDNNITNMVANSPEEAGVHFLADEKCEINNLLDYLGHLGNVHKMLVFRVSKESTTDVSLYQPFYDKFPLTVYNIPYAFETNNEEYHRFVQYIAKTSAENSRHLN